MKWTSFKERLPTHNQHILVMSFDEDAEEGLGLEAGVYGEWVCFGIYAVHEEPMGGISLYRNHGQGGRESDGKMANIYQRGWWVSIEDLARKSVDWNEMPANISFVTVDGGSQGGLIYRPKV